MFKWFGLNWFHDLNGLDWFQFLQNHIQRINPDFTKNWTMLTSNYKCFQILSYLAFLLLILKNNYMIPHPFLVQSFIKGHPSYSSYFTSAILFCSTKIPVNTLSSLHPPSEVTKSCPIVLIINCGSLKLRPLLWLTTCHNIIQNAQW